MRIVILVLLALLALVLVAAALVLFLPAWVTVELRHGRLTVRVRVRFFRFSRLPLKEWEVGEK